VQLTFKHAWFQGVDIVSYWIFFNKFNLETEKKEEVQNVKKFFVRYSSPSIPQTEKNLILMSQLVNISAQFTACVRESTGKYCTLCRSNNTILFGRSD